MICWHTLTRRQSRVHYSSTRNSGLVLYAAARVLHLTLEHMSHQRPFFEQICACAISVRAWPACWRRLIILHEIILIRAAASSSLRRHRFTTLFYLLPAILLTAIVGCEVHRYVPTKITQLTTRISPDTYRYVISPNIFPTNFLSPIAASDQNSYILIVFLFCFTFHRA